MWLGVLAFVYNLPWFFLFLEVAGINPILVHGKAGVFITGLEAVGRYGVKIIFSDGHDSGIYTWAYLRELCTEKEALWSLYLEKLHQAQQSRDPEKQVVQIQPPHSP